MARVRRTMGTPFWLLRTSPNRQTHDNPADWTAYLRVRTIGTDGSNSSRSANESCLCGFSARNGAIAHACGLICVMRGTGENHFPAVRAQTRPKSLLASEAVPSMLDARRDRFDDGLGRNCEEMIERKPTRRSPRLLLARSRAEGDRSVRPRPRR
jgi:hypothetical protein